MSIKEKELLLKLHQQILKITQQAQTTYSPYSGSVTPPTVYQPSTLPQPQQLPIKYKG